MDVDFKEIIDRGFAFEEEMDELYKNSRFNGFRRMFWTEDMEEHFHGIQLDSPYFILVNNLAFIRGPRSLVGMVGIYEMKRNKFIMNHEQSFAAWRKAGQAAIDYWNSKMEKIEEEASKNE